MQSDNITADDILQMVRHWLSTPVYSYFGSDYGFDKHALLFNPLTMESADEFIRKLKQDVPVLTMLPAGAINLYSVPQLPDKVVFMLQIGDSAISIT